MKFEQLVACLRQFRQFYSQRKEIWQTLSAEFTARFPLAEPADAILFASEYQP